MKYINYFKNHWVQASTLVIVAILIAGVSKLASAQNLSTIPTYLDVGNRGPAVTTLQTFLATNPKVYPQGLVTGYYGPLTEAAVRNFQIGYAIDPVGRVGPITQARINGLISTGQSIDVSAPSQMNIVVSQINRNSARISWNTDEPALGKVFYSNVPITGTEPVISKVEPTLSGSVVSDMSINSSKSLQLTGLSANTTYYYVVESIDSVGNVMVSPQGTFKTSI